jgi:alkanesulfonate monooxygenase SsuD/methylene tetrahydromethanopterin reductase-like flavin-dependent oxidoreductase (luciferase family)
MSEDVLKRYGLFLQNTGNGVRLATDHGDGVASFGASKEAVQRMAADLAAAEERNEVNAQAIIDAVCTLVGCDVVPSGSRSLADAANGAADAIGKLRARVRALEAVGEAAKVVLTTLVPTMTALVTLAEVADALPAIDAAVSAPKDDL